MILLFYFFKLKKITYIKINQDILAIEHYEIIKNSIKKHYQALKQVELKRKSSDYKQSA